MGHWKHSQLSNGSGRRHGFTLLEILIVIGVIAILVAIAVYAYRAIENSAAAGETRTVLDTANSLIAEYEAAGNSVAKLNAAARPGQPGDVNTTTGRDNAIHNYSEPVMALLLTIPRNQSAISQLPAKMVMTNSQTGTGLIHVPSLVDGWGNPIIFVPARGLAITETSGSYVVRSSGTVKSTEPIKPTDRPFWASAGLDGDFGSAVGNADDNIYSFSK